MSIATFNFIVCATLACFGKGKYISLTFYVFEMHVRASDISVFFPQRY